MASSTLKIDRTSQNTMTQQTATVLEFINLSKNFFPIRKSILEQFSHTHRLNNRMFSKDVILLNSYLSLVWQDCFTDIRAYLQYLQIVYLVGVSAILTLHRTYAAKALVPLEFYTLFCLYFVFVL